MSDQSQRNEKATKRRQDKARKEGRFVVSREAVGAIEFLLLVALGVAFASRYFSLLTEFTRLHLRAAFDIALTPKTTEKLFLETFRRLILPLLVFSTAIVTAGLATQLAITRFGFALNRTMPDFTRWNPGKKLHELPSQNLPALLQAIILVPAFFYAAWWILRGHLHEYLALPFMAPGRSLEIIALSWKGFLWRTSVVIVLLGAVDFVRQHRRFQNGLKMTKQEVREEAKESEGNPQIKGRIRRIQRDVARRSMMKEVPLASAIIVNPTHYAVALRYDTASMAAPRVAAKGKNYLARRIREIAAEHQIPIVENPPLAQALYKTVEVGQEIPVQMYRAVAEILAYIFRLANHRAGNRPIQEIRDRKN